MLDSAIWQNEKFATMPAMARLLLIGMIDTADDQGRGKAHPIYLRSHVFPYDDVTAQQITDWLEFSVQNETILLYTVDGKEYYQLLNWWAYQTHQYAMPSQYPKPRGWQDRIRKTLTKGVIVTCNWVAADGHLTPNTCNEQGLSIQVNDQVNDQVNEPQTDQVNIQVKVKDYVKGKVGIEDYVEDKGVPLTPTEALAEAVAAVCKMDVTLRRKRIYDAAAKLLAANYEARHVCNFGLWWLTDPWRAVHTPVPSIEKLLDMIAQGAHYVAPNGHGPPNETDPQMLAYAKARAALENS